jgi:3-oxoacyl-[acyl-carrier-protein] synthase-3
MEKVFTNVERYGNMSAATVPVALCEALEEERVKLARCCSCPRLVAGSRSPATCCAGARVSPLGTTNFPAPGNQTALELAHKYRSIKSLRRRTGLKRITGW